VLYVSTRGKADPVDFRGALLAGLASDGGLYVPEEIPLLPAGWEEWNYQQAVTATLTLFGAEQVGPLVNQAASRFAHPEVAPVVDVGERMVFELFWGPTLSFKDHALQVLGRLFDVHVESPSIVLGATSGDTGSAAIEAVRGRANLRIVILFPDGMVSDFQRRQMTTVPDENVLAVAVRGNFDDCQRMVKETFAEVDGLLAINSINWARIAAQVGYYVYLAARVGNPIDVVVPTGNFGNVYSCWLAKQMGASIEQITIANNANHALSDLVNAGAIGNDPVRATVAPAMDIAVPSNLERFSGDPGREFRAGHATDDEIGAAMRAVYEESGYVLDPHTATAWVVGEGQASDRQQVVIGTAHPAKFAETVITALGTNPKVLEGFDDLAGEEERVVTIDPEASALRALIR
jgi:threonine synthase